MKLRKKYLIGGVFAYVAAVLFLSYLYWTTDSDFAGDLPETKQNEIARTFPSVLIGKNDIQVEVAKDESALQKGLSGRPSLEPNKGMLFVFSSPYRYRFWMPDMRFPLDIIWIRDGKIIDMDENVSNKFDPAKPKFYIPSTPAKYVLEVNAGFAKNKNISVGDSVAFSHIE